MYLREVCILHAINRKENQTSMILLILPPFSNWLPYVLLGLGLGLGLGY